MRGWRILSLEALENTVKHKRAIETYPDQGYGHQGYIPASWVYNLNASCVHAWIKRGMYQYVKKPKQ